MVWTTPVPDALVNIRTMLVACASAVTAGLAEARFHYPTATMNGASADTDSACHFVCFGARYSSV